MAALYFGRRSIVVWSVVFCLSTGPALAGGAGEGCGPDLVSAALGGNVGGGDLPPTGPPSAKDPNSKSYVQLVKDAYHGKCLNSDPKAFWNFYKTLFMVWGFQIAGWMKIEKYIDQYVFGTAPKAEAAAKYTEGFPFAILANTAFIIRVQSEVGCNLVNPEDESKKNYSVAPSELMKRYRAFAKLTPLAASSAFVSVAAQKLLYKMADEISERTVGYDLGNYQSPLSMDFLHSTASDTASIVLFELVYLFPKWALFETNLMNRGFPALRTAARGFGSRLPGALGYAPRVLAFGTEWGYRIGMPILVDNPILFEMLEADGLTLGELPFASHYVPESKKDTMLFFPQQIFRRLMLGMGLTPSKATEDMTSDQPTPVDINVGIESIGTLR